MEFDSTTPPSLWQWIRQRIPSWDDSKIDKVVGILLNNEIDDLQTLCCVGEELLATEEGLHRLGVTSVGLVISFQTLHKEVKKFVENNGKKVISSGSQNGMEQKQPYARPDKSIANIEGPNNRPRLLHKTIASDELAGSQVEEALQIARNLRTHILKYSTNGALAAASCGSYFRTLDPHSSFPGLKRFCSLSEVSRFVHFEEDDAAPGKGWVVAARSDENPSSGPSSAPEMGWRASDRDAPPRPPQAIPGLLRRIDRPKESPAFGSGSNRGDVGEGIEQGGKPTGNGHGSPDVSQVARSIRSHVLKYGTNGALAAASCGSYFRTLDPQSSFPGLKRFCSLPEVSRFVHFEEDDAAPGKGWVVAARSDENPSGPSSGPVSDHSFGSMEPKSAPLRENALALKKMLQRPPGYGQGNGPNPSGPYRGRPRDPCRYFQNGFCKNGGQCKFLHEGESGAGDAGPSRETFRAASGKMSGPGSTPQSMSQEREFPTIPRKSAGAADTAIVDTEFNLAEMMDPALPATDRDYFASRVYLLLCTELKNRFELQLNLTSKGCILGVKGTQTEITAARAALQDRINGVVFWMAPIDMNDRAGNELAYEWTKSRLQHLSHNYQLFTRENYGGGSDEDSVFDHTPTFHVYSAKPRDELKRSKVVVISLPEQRRTLETWRNDIESNLQSFEVRVWRVPREMDGEQRRLLGEECRLIEGRHKFLRLDFRPAEGTVFVLGAGKEALRRLDAFIDGFDNVTRMVSFPPCEPLMQSYLLENSTDSLIRYALDMMRSKAQTDPSIVINFVSYDRSSVLSAAMGVGGGARSRPQDAFEVTGPRRGVEAAAAKLKDLLEEFVSTMSLQQCVVRLREEVSVRALIHSRADEFAQVSVHFGSDRFKRHYSCVWGAGVRIEIVHCDFFATATRLRADTLVYATPEDLQHRQGLANSVLSAAGDDFSRDCEDLYDMVTKMPAGSVVSRATGRLVELGFRNLIQAIMPTVEGETPSEADWVTFRASVTALLVEAVSIGVVSLAVPGLCFLKSEYGQSEWSELIVTNCCREVLQCLTAFLSTEPAGSLRCVLLFDHRLAVVQAYQTALSGLRGHDLDQLPSASLASSAHESIDLSDETLNQRRIELFGNSSRVGVATSKILDCIHQK